MTTINGVIGELEQIISYCKKNRSRQAYFAALYKAMTCSVQQAIDGGYFSDSARMEKLDVLFAGRYIEAWHCNQKNQPCSASWKTAFDACEHSNLVVLQHLILGINTHINLDLAIAAATTSPGEAILDLESDFIKINTLIASLTDVVQARLEEIWWPMRFLKRVVNGQEKAVINFSITSARKTSWANAVALATITGDAATNYISGMDNVVNTIAQKIIDPGILTKLALTPVRWFEYRDINKITDLLNQPIPVNKKILPGNGKDFNP
jgi:hypothetical protein